MKDDPATKDLESLSSLPAWSNIPESTAKTEKDSKPELPPDLALTLAELRKVLF